MSIRPPGPQGVPLFGNGQQFADDPFQFMTACADAYGDVVAFDLGPIPLYMLTNPQDIKRVLVTEPDRFPKLDLGDDAIYELLGDGLLLSEGETWQQQRQLANPAFHGRRIRTLGDMMVEHTESAVDDWNDGDRLDIQIEMARLTVRIIVTAMLGTDIDDERIRTVQENLEPLGARFEPNAFRRLIPDWAPTAENREFRAAIDELESVIDDIIAERRQTGYTAGAETAVDDDTDSLDRYTPHVFTTTGLVILGMLFTLYKPIGGMILMIPVIGLFITDFFEFESREVEARNDMEFERPKAALGVSVLVLIYAAYYGLQFLYAPYLDLIFA